MGNSVDESFEVHSVLAKVDEQIEPNISQIPQTKISFLSVKSVQSVAKKKEFMASL